MAGTHEALPMMEMREGDFTEDRLASNGPRSRRVKSGSDDVVYVVPVTWSSGVICCLVILCVLLTGMVLGEMSSGVCVPGSCGIPLPGQAPTSHQTGGGMDMGKHEDDDDDDHDHHNNNNNGKEENHDKDESSGKENNTPAKFTKEKLAAARTAAQDLRKMIYEYYGEHADILLNAGWGVEPTGKDDGNISHLGTQGFDKMVDQFARAIVSDEQDTFIIGTIGSSVAAGHDNCNYDSYERQLERMFAPVWNAAGTKLQVQNAGEGGACGDGHQNQVFCVKQNISPFADIVHYSWTYFESGGASKQHEQLIRWVQMMDRQAPVFLFNTGGKDIYDGNNRCYNANGKSSDPDTKVHQAYKKYGFNSFCLEGALSSGKLYGGKVWGKVGDGYHNTTRYGENEPSTERKDSLGVVFRNWHPGPLGFQTLADNLAYHYAYYMLQAFDLIEAEWKRGGDPRKKWTMKRIPALLSSLPPIQTGCEYCDLEEPPECLNLEDPVYGWHGAAKAPKDDDLNPYKDQEQNWALKKEDWTSLIPKFEQGYYRNDSTICQHLDRCGYFTSSTPDDGWLVLKLPKMQRGVVILCGMGKSGGDSLINNPDLEVFYDGILIAHEEWDKFPQVKCARITKTFPKNLEDSTGHAYLSMRIKPDAKSPQTVRITQIITV